MGAEAGSFYVPLGEGRFRATELTASPWGSGSQHGGSPTALLGRTLESDASGEGGVFARLAFEFLGPVPVGELSVEAATGDALPGVAHLGVLGLLAQRPRPRTPDAPRPPRGQGETLLRDGPRGRVPSGHRGQIRRRVVARAGTCRGLAAHAGAPAPGRGTFAAGEGARRRGLRQRCGRRA